MALWNTIKPFSGYDSDPATEDAFGYEISLINGGYQVLKDGVAVIDQPFLPGVEGKTPFATPEDAEASANAETRKLIEAELAAQQ